MCLIEILWIVFTNLWCIWICVHMIRELILARSWILLMITMRWLEIFRVILFTWNGFLNCITLLALFVLSRDRIRTSWSRIRDSRVRNGFLDALPNHIFDFSSFARLFTRASLAWNIISTTWLILLVRRLSWTRGRCSFKLNLLFLST